MSIEPDLTYVMVLPASDASLTQAECDSFLAAMSRDHLITAHDLIMGMVEPIEGRCNLETVEEVSRGIALDVLRLDVGLMYNFDDWETLDATRRLVFELKAVIARAPAEFAYKARVSGKKPAKKPAKKRTQKTKVGKHKKRKL